MGWVDWVSIAWNWLVLALVSTFISSGLNDDSFSFTETPKTMVSLDVRLRVQVVRVVKVRGYNIALGLWQDGR